MTTASGQLASEARVVARQLARSRNFTLVALAMFGIALGPCLAMLAIVDSVDFAPLPFRDSGSLVDVRESSAPTDPTCPNCLLPTSYRTFVDWREQLRSLRTLAAYIPRTRAVWEGRDGYSTVWLTEVSGDFFAALGVAPQLGRVMVEHDVQPGATPALVLSYRVWQSDFAGDPSVIGRTVHLDPSRGSIASYTVIGVMPESFQYPMGASMWIPIAPDMSASRGEREFSVLGRLRPGQSVRQADAELGAVHTRLSRSDSLFLRGYGAMVVPLRQRVASLASNARFVLLSVTLALLAVISTNLLGLFVARAAARQADTGVRLALGASRRDIIRPLCIEVLMLGVGGLIVALALARWILDIGRVLLRTDFVGVPVEMRWPVILFAVGVVALLAVVLGVFTATATLRGATLYQLRLVTVRSKYQTGAAALCSLQVALALVLVACGAALSREFLRLRFAAAGYDANGLVLIDVGKVRAASPREGWQDLADQLRKLPGVDDVAFYVRTAEAAEPVEPSASGTNPVLEHVRVSETFFATLGIRFTSGHAVALDGRALSSEIVVNQSTARALWPSSGALGKSLMIGSRDNERRHLVTVVGVVEDARLLTPLEAAPHMIVYEIASSAEIVAPLIFVRSRADDQGEVEGAIRRLVAGVFPPSEGSFIVTSSMEYGLRDETRGLRVMAGVTGGVALVTLLLAVIGLYGMVVYSLNGRVHEIGVRIALGASGSRILWFSSREGALILIAGIGAGLVGALRLAPIMLSLVGGKARLDPPVLGASIAVLVVATIAAISSPVIRALRTDPARAIQLQ